jgi:hypothetical protein
MCEQNWYDVVTVALRNLLSEFPGLELLEKPCGFKDRLAVRFAINLRTDTHEHDTRAEIFIFVTLEEMNQAAGELEPILRKKISGSSFIDAKHGQISTFVSKGINADWKAMSLGGSNWMFDQTQGQWVSRVAAA